MNNLVKLAILYNNGSDEEIHILVNSIEQKKDLMHRLFSTSAIRSTFLVELSTKAIYTINLDQIARIIVYDHTLEELLDLSKIPEKDKV